METKSQALVLKAPSTRALAPYEFKAPPKKIVKAQKVLTEDEFSQGISKIIERDFFPDIPKLEAQADYYDALQRNDLVKLREIQMKFGRPDTAATGGANTPATFETPLERRKTTPANKNRPSTDKVHNAEAGQTHEVASKDIIEEDYSPDVKAPKLRLDSFLSRNTSEDSASFEELLTESERKRQLKHEWVFQKEKEQLAEHKDFIALPSIEDQAVIEEKPLHVNTWKYVNENAIMYVPEGCELSAKEMIEEKKHKPKAIIHENTRFQYNPFNNLKSKDAMKQAASFKALINQGKIGHDGKEMLPSQSPQMNGYGFVGTPSPAPGVADSPMMTWGEVEGTPARLDASETQPATTPGPVFRIPDVPKRELLGLQLSEKASKAHRAKKEEALKQVTRRFASPSPTSKISLSAVERLNSMSPAAQKLASKRLGIRVSTDKALAASYSPSPSPSHGLPGTKTPIRLTPLSKRSGRSSLPGTPGNKTPSSERGNNTPSTETSSDVPSLTDHLLNLPKRKRKAAKDFF